MPHQKDTWPSNHWQQNGDIILLCNLLSQTLPSSTCNMNGDIILLHNLLSRHISLLHVEHMHKWREKVSFLSTSSLLIAPQSSTLEGSPGSDLPFLFEKAQKWKKTEHTSQMCVGWRHRSFPCLWRDGKQVGWAWKEHPRRGRERGKRLCLHWPRFQFRRIKMRGHSQIKAHIWSLAPLPTPSFLPPYTVIITE